MKKDTQLPEDSKQTETVEKTETHLPEKEFDADNEVHKTSPDLIQKEDHHLPVDDEIKKG